MAEREPTYAPAAAGDLIDYKPLSLLAVAGFLVAALYLGFVLVSMVAALYKGEPFFMPDVALALALAGAVLSGLGLWQIHNSEGTRAGAGLARWGLGISLLAGLGYFTYHNFTGLAICQQANNFLVEKETGFFTRLQGTEADVNAAFLTVLDIADRTARPENTTEMIRRFDIAAGQNPKGVLTQFLESPVVRLLRLAGPGSVKIEPLAVRTWAYENGAYHILRKYKIATDEATYEVSMNVISIEPVAEGEKRSWKVEMLGMLTALQPISRTDLGNRRLALRNQAFDFLTDPRTGWFSSLSKRQRLEVYLGTKPLADRKALRERWDAMIARIPPVAAGGDKAEREKAEKAEEELLTREMPGYHEPTKMGEYFQTEKVRLWDPKFHLFPAFAKGFLPYLTLVGVPNYEMAPCRVQHGEVLITLQAHTLIPVPGLKESVVLLFNITVAAPETVDPAAANAAQEWYMKTAELVRALPVPPRQQQ